MEVVGYIALGTVGLLVSLKILEIFCRLITASWRDFKWFSF